jgi:hypothetical protein
MVSVYPKSAVRNNHPSTGGPKSKINSNKLLITTTIMFSREKSTMFNAEKASQPLPPTYSETTAVPSSSTSAFRTRFASMSMHMSDRLRFLLFPIEVVQACQQTVTHVWRKGIQQTRTYGGSQEMQLYGRPWSSGSSDQAIEARRLLTALLERLHSLGWVMTLSTDVSKKKLDKDALLFRYQDPPPAQCEWASIAFSKTDKIRFIDCKNQPLHLS